MLLSPLTFTYNTAMQRNNHRALLPRLLNIRGLHPHSAHGADPWAKPLSFQQQSTSWAEDGSISTGDSKCLLVKARLFQFGIPIYFCRGRKALPHRETSEMCFFCTSFLLQDSSSWAGGAKGAVTARRSTTHTHCLCTVLLEGTWAEGFCGGRGGAFSHMRLWRLLQLWTEGPSPAQNHSVLWCS